MSTGIGSPTGDVSAVALIAGTFLNWLPAIGALLSIIYMTIRILETKTVQRFLRKRRNR